MVLSKSRSGNKCNPSILSRTKLCRGDSPGAQIDSKAVVSLERKPSISGHSSENVSRRVLEMPTWQLEEEIKLLREQLGCLEAERDRALDELREMKQVVNETNYLREILYSTQKELHDKSVNMENLRAELDKAAVEREVAEEKLREGLSNAEASAARSRQMLSDLTSRIKELEVELENKKSSESKTLISLEHAKLEVESLNEKIKLMEESGQPKAIIEERENVASLTIKSLRQEVASLKCELKSATEAEEKSKKAMDGLALALKEVAGEAIEAKEDVKLKLSATQLELDQVKRENTKLKERIKRKEERYQREVEEARKEMEVHKNTVERLRLEAEETLLAWNGKEVGFVSCIKRAEEERDDAHRESVRLRDLLKQAISEANAAKAAANIAIDENSKLKDALADKEGALLLLIRENERLKH
ncbi:unnamed protein product [Cuscuta epithymum]|uniref:Uncharacterized protein n=1 Tax=Cuscuta epithymum TaxID=186058 RepID=A0AAV0G5G0_9ASTE|nr:unnamed protein product [Cuscuta epithymum]